MRATKSVAAALALLASLDALTLAGCAGKSVQAPRGQAPGESAAAHASDAPGPRAGGDNLTDELARWRRAQIANVAYRLEFTFGKGRPDFDGRARIELELSRVDSPLSLDTLGQKFRRVAVNGVEVRDYRLQEGSLEIPAARLREHTVIELAYTGVFDSHARGPQRFVDPADHREYIHTDFEPYEAHELFPCFDQPDLKARYEIAVRAPADWEALSNALPVDAAAAMARPHARGERTVRFRPTEPISPYLVFVGAGPFRRWTSTASLDDGSGLPLAIYARQSVARHVDAERLFEVTRRGLAFFGAYFDFRYPFPKYDHIFIADYGHGAMENPGAVTMNERMIFRGPVSADGLVDRDATILHEMAHMWFGDLVTTKWWNDTWLNESFATYMSHVALAGLGQAEESWLSFNGSKGWAYREDELVTTHPIEAPVHDTQGAGANFDGITYGKGASALKQLAYAVGEDHFREGVRAYFRRHAWGNARREDFVAAVAGAAGADLEAWTRAWLQSAGLQRVTPDWACSGGRLSRLSIVQEPSSSGHLSPHKTEIALIRRDPGGTGTLQLIDRIVLAYDGRRTDVVDALGKECPDLVFANFGDHDYASFDLDPTSLQATLSSLAAMPDALMRQMVWESLYGMVRDGRLPLGEYLSAAVRLLPRETSVPVLARLLGRHSELREAYWDYLTPAERDRLAPAWERTAWRQVATSDDRDAQLLWFDFYVATAHTPEAAQTLEGVLADGRLPGTARLPLDQPRRWNVIGRLAHANRPGVLPVIEREERRDPSNEGRREAFAARATLPDPAGKRRLWDQLIREDALPWTLRGQGLRSFNDPDRPELSRPFVDEYFAEAARVDWSERSHLVRGFFHDLFPPLCSPELLDQSRERLRAAEAGPRLSEIARRAWRERNDELERCIKVRALDAGISVDPAHF